MARTGHKHDPTLNLGDSGSELPALRRLELMYRDSKKAEIVREAAKPLHLLLREARRVHKTDDQRLEWCRREFAALGGNQGEMDLYVSGKQSGMSSTDAVNEILQRHSDLAEETIKRYRRAFKKPKGRVAETSKLQFPSNWSAEVLDRASGNPGKGTIRILCSARISGKAFEDLSTAEEIAAVRLVSSTGELWIAPDVGPDVWERLLPSIST